MTQAEQAMRAALYSVLRRAPTQLQVDRALREWQANGMSLYPKRKPPRARAPATATKMTPELARRVRRYVRAHPGLSNRAYGLVFNLDGGRISEARDNLW